MLRIDRAQPGERAAEWVTGPLAADTGSEVAGQRHDQMTPRDERLLVGRCDDLAGSEGGDDGPETDDPTRPDDDKVDVGAGRELRERVRSAVLPRAERQMECRAGSRLAEGDHRGPEASRLVAQCDGVGACRQRHDPEVIGQSFEDVDRLPPDRPGGAEDRDAEPTGGISGQRQVRTA